MGQYVISQALLALWRVPGVGPKTFNRLLSHFGDAKTALSASQSTLMQLGVPDYAHAFFKQPDYAGAECDLNWALQANCQILTLDNPQYSRYLSQIAYPPPLLFVQGDVSVLNMPQIAIVGARNATQDGLRWAQYFAMELAKRGLTITSGLALGIDGAAHKGALQARGKTCGVLGCGIDVIYPKRHAYLFEALAQTGAIVSTYPTQFRPDARHFPQRNYIISGMSLATMVVEASLKSGSLITAQAALSQNRDVFAMPGPIHSPVSRGCHALIKQGAKCIETIDDILTELEPQLAGFNLPPPKTVVQDLDHSESNLVLNSKVFENNPRNSQPLSDFELLSYIGTQPISLEGVIARSGLTRQVVCAMMLDLELAGNIRKCAGGYVTASE